MRFRLLSFTAAIILAAPNAFPQIECDTQTCTFTLSFDSARGGLGNPFLSLTGAPYSGQESNETRRTLQDGTHTTSTSAGPMTYRDSKGRVRTEESVYGRQPSGFPTSPDDFTVIQIHDPVAGFQYILDPVEHIAHRTVEPGKAMEFTPVRLRPSDEPSSISRPAGGKVTQETLGPEAMFGAAAIGERTIHTIPAQAPGEHPAVTTEETWLDPKTGILLLRKNDSAIGDGTTTTMLNYSNAEPAASLFQIPEGYKIVDETAPFKVVHTRTSAAPAFTRAGPQSPRSSAECDTGSCTLTFDLTSRYPMTALTGAPYSGQPITEIPAKTNPNGRQIAPRTVTQPATYRDSAGRVRTDKVFVSRVNGGQIPDDFALVEIDDPAAGYQYILDTVDRVAYRVPWQARLVPFRPLPAFQPPGTRTSPDGVVDVEEDLAETTINGVKAAGHRSTQTTPPGSRQGNDKPIVHVVERWTDPATGIEILRKQSGSEGGLRYSIPDYKAGDPDPSLFLVPSDYKIVDEASKFTFTIPRAKLGSELR